MVLTSKSSKQQVFLKVAATKTKKIKPNNKITMKTALNHKFESFEAINDDMLKKVLGGGNPPPEDGSDAENLNNQVKITKIIW